MCRKHPVMLMDLWEGDETGEHPGSLYLEILIILWHLSIKKIPILLYYRLSQTKGEVSSRPIHLEAKMVSS